MPSPHNFELTREALINNAQRILNTLNGPGFFFNSKQYQDLGFLKLMVSVYLLESMSPVFFEKKEKAEDGVSKKKLMCMVLILMGVFFIISIKL
jgi:hypothetical protein